MLLPDFAESKSTIKKNLNQDFLQICSVKEALTTYFQEIPGRNPMENKYWHLTS